MKLVFSFLLIAVAVLNSNHSKSQIDLTKGLVLHLDLDSTLLDSSPFNNNAIAFGAIPAIDRFGCSLSAFYFDGVDDYIQIPHDTSLSFVDQYTLMAWVNQETTNFPSGGRRIIDKHHMSTGDGYAMITATPHPANWIHAISIKSGVSSKPIVNNTWQHLAIVWDKGIVDIYIDGQLDKRTNVSSTSTKINSNSWPVYLGTAQSNGVPAGDHFWHGALDDVRLFNRPLTPLDIDSVFREIPSTKTSGTANLDSGLVLNLHMDSASLSDASLYANHAISSGAIPTFDRHGRANGAYYFDGQDDFLRISDANSLDLDTAFTWSVWVNQHSSGMLGATGRRIFDKHHEAMGDGYVLLTNLPNDIHVGTFKSLVGSKPIINNTWHHIVATWENGFVNLYLDGQPIGQRDIAAFGSQISMNNWPLYIGCAQQNGLPAPNYYWHGVLDDLRIYNRKMCYEEITALHKLDTIYARRNTAANKIKFQNRFRVFPNPGGDHLGIEVNELSEILLIDVMTIDGRLIEQFVISKPFETYNVRELPHGMYLMKLKSSKEVFGIKKWIKIH